MGAIIKRLFVEEYRELLPKEWQLEILTYLPDKERFKLSVVCSDFWCSAKQRYHELAMGDNPYWKIEVIAIKYNLGLVPALRNPVYVDLHSSIQNYSTKKLRISVSVSGTSVPYEQLMSSCGLTSTPCDMEISFDKHPFRRRIRPFQSQKPQFCTLSDYPKIRNIYSLSIYDMNGLEFNDISPYYNQASFIYFDCSSFYEKIDPIWFTGHQHLKGISLYAYDFRDAHEGGPEIICNIKGPLQILSISDCHSFFDVQIGHLPPNVIFLHVDECIWDQYSLFTGDDPVSPMNQIEILMLSYTEYLEDESIPVLLPRIVAIINAVPNARKIYLPKELQSFFQSPKRKNLHFLTMPESWTLKQLEEFL